MDWKNNLVDRKSVNFKGKEKLFLVEKKNHKRRRFLRKGIRGKCFDWRE